MHVFLAILAIFMAPTPGHPAQIVIGHFPAASMEACRAELGLAANSISQKPEVSYVEPIGCADLSNPNDKGV